jgi:hypothetical protein
MIQEVINWIVMPSIFPKREFGTNFATIHERKFLKGMLMAFWSTNIRNRRISAFKTEVKVHILFRPVFSQENTFYN